MTDVLYNALVALNGAIVDTHGHECYFFHKWGNILSPLPNGFDFDEAHTQAMKLLKDMQPLITALTVLGNKAADVAGMTANNKDLEK